MSFDVLILGASGFGGGELLRLLHGHPDVRSVRGTSRKSAGRPFAEVHPHLRDVYSESFDAEPPLEALADAPQPVIFSALPHLTFAYRYPELAARCRELGIAERCLWIDLSADFRLRDPARFAAIYGREHPCPELLGDWVYGLSEHRYEALREARQVANPGCFATALQLAVLPLVGLEPEGLLAITALTGSSGSGAAPGLGTHHPTRSNDLRAYKMLAHRHQAELEQGLARASAALPPISFVPHSGPFVRGIFATVSTLLPAGVTAERVREVFVAAYGASPFVRLVEGSPRLAAVVGSNFCDIGWALSGRQLVVMATLDNLVKGMAGQAVQNLNLMAGLPPGRGLFGPGRYPG